MDGEKNMTLLEKAIAATPAKRGNKRPSDEQLQLALAWAQDRITITQVAAAMNVKTGGVYPFLATALKRHFQSVAGALADNK